MKYCRHHYPKIGPLIAASLGLIFSLLLSVPLQRVFSQLWPLHYLDGHPPVLVALSPDVKTFGYVDPNTQAINLAYRDDCSGVDLDKCEFELFRAKGDGREPVISTLDAATSGCRLTFGELLGRGEYILRILLSDRAKNQTESEYPFVVPETNIVSIHVTREEYGTAEHRILFQSFLDEWYEKLDLHLKKLYVYRYSVHNTADKTYCRDLHLTIGNQITILSWKETMAMDCRGIECRDSAQAAQLYMPVNTSFTSQQLVGIEEMGPGGLAQFVALSSYWSSERDGPKMPLPKDIDVFGNYVSRGYGRTDVVPIRCWIPIKELKSSN